MVDASWAAIDDRQQCLLAAGAPFHSVQNLGEAWFLPESLWRPGGGPLLQAERRGASPAGLRLQRLGAQTCVRCCLLEGMTQLHRLLKVDFQKKLSKIELLCN